MYKLKKLSDVDKIAKIQHSIALLIEALLSITCLGLLIHYMIIGDPDNRFLSALGGVIVFLAPFLFELIFKIRFSFSLHLLFIVHLTFSMLLGCVLNFHNTVGPFDEIAHLVFGYLACVYILYIFYAWKDFKHQSPIFIATIIFVLSMGTAAIWELMEFFVDVFFSQTSLGHASEELIQQGIALGYSGVSLNIYTLQNGVLVWDTITDMALHIAGTLIFFIQYLISRHVKKSYLLGSFERDYIKNKQDFYYKTCDIKDTNIEQTITCTDIDNQNDTEKV